MFATRVTILSNVKWVVLLSMRHEDHVTIIKCLVMEIAVGLFERHPLEGTDSQLIKPHFLNSYTHINGERDLARYAGRIIAYGSYSGYLSVGIRRSMKLGIFRFSKIRPNFGSTFTPPNFTPEKTTSERTKWFCSCFIAIRFLFYECIDFLKSISWKRWLIFFGDNSF